MVGTVLGPSRLWFTIGYGIINEVYYPQVDMPQIRDLGFIVADGRGFWVQVKRNADYTLTTAGAGISAVQILHRHPGFELSLRIAPDLDRDVLLIEAVFTGDAGLRLYALLAPHLGGTDEDNIAEVFVSRDRAVLCAERGAFAVALAATEATSQHDAWVRASAGFVGGDKEAAATLAISALLQPFETAWHRYVRSWEAWHANNVDPTQCLGECQDAASVSAMVLRTHQDKTFRGATVASLSIPWGNSTDDSGGYHLVWPRDLVESAGALLAFGGVEDARNILRYLIATQLADGRWSRNQWLGGRPHWSGIQLDEAAFPVLLASALAEADALNGIQIADMVRRVLALIALHGPATDQERWEETPGVNTFTLAAAIPALDCGAELLGGEERHDIRLLADDWNSRIEEWCTGANPDLIARHGISAYYVRAAPAAIFEDRAAIRGPVPVRNHDGEYLVPADTLISTDFLQLVRFGLRRPDDPAVTSTLALVDAQLRAETPAGSSWYRYNGDGYGAHADGRPFDGTGHGRVWPLLTGERGHYELAAGRRTEARALLGAMQRMSSRMGLIPEQVWDSEPIPERYLFPGRPSGSAMPLVWAHAEFLKLAVSLRLGRPIGRPEPVWLRYGGARPVARRAHWTRRTPVGWIRAGQHLRLLFGAPALVHWGLDGWQDPRNTRTMPSPLGLHRAELATQDLEPGRRIVFAIQDLRSGNWAERDWSVVIAPDDSLASARVRQPQSSPQRLAAEAP